MKKPTIANSSPHRDIAMGSILRVANLVAGAVVSLLMMPFIVRTLGDRMYGIWILLATFIGYYGLLDLGLSSAVGRYLASAVGAVDHEQCNRVYNTSLRMFSVLGMAVLAISVIAAALAPMFCKTQEDASVFWRLILILGIALALDFPSKVYVGLLQANLHFHLLGVFELLSLALRTGLVLAVLLTGHKVVALGWVTLLSGIPGKLLTVYYAYKRNPFLRLDSKYWTPATARSLFSYSVSSFAVRMADLLRFQVDGPVVAAFVGLGAVTHYKIAGTLAQYYLGIMLAATQAFPTLFSRKEGSKDFAGIKRTFFFATKLSTCAAMFMGFGLIAWGKPFIIRWMGPQYLDAYPCLVALVIGYMFSQSQSASVSLLFGVSKHKVFAWFNSIEGVANLVLSLLLVRKYGILGVALGTMIPMVITKLFVQPLYVCRVAAVPYAEYVKRMARTLAAVAAALVLPALLAIYFSAPSYRNLGAIAGLSFFLYAVPLWFFEFNSGETRLLQQALLPRLALRRGTNI